MDLYREELMDHYKNPRNYGRLKNPTKTIRESNPLCGDVVDVDVSIEGGVIKDISFTGSGCAISTAALSMLTEKVKGMKVEEVKKITKDEVLNEVNPTLTISRIKCATLGYNALLRSLSST